MKGTSLKQAWQSWQKFGDRSRSGDCKPLIIICLRDLFEEWNRMLVIFFMTFIRNLFYFLYICNK